MSRRRSWPQVRSGIQAPFASGRKFAKTAVMMSGKVAERHVRLVPTGQGWRCLRPAADAHRQVLGNPLDVIGTFWVVRPRLGNQMELVSALVEQVMPDLLGSAHICRPVFRAVEVVA